VIVSVMRLLKDRPEPTCIGRQNTVEAALKLMIEMDFSQLPVVDDRDDLLGLISEQSISRTLFHMESQPSQRKDEVRLLSLTVDHCMDQPITLQPGDDFMRALRLLNDHYALVVVADNHPIGILTDFDTTRFFHDLYGTQLHIHKIELMLREYIKRAFPTEEELRRALLASIGPDSKDPQQPSRPFHKLDFAKELSVIECNVNWPRFDADLGPKPYFSGMMNQVRAIRNQLLHFRGAIFQTDHDAVLRALYWMETRPNAHIVSNVEIIPADAEEIEDAEDME
jgi:CBS domain-containing protein